ncbi:MAG: hypothetical protein Q9223_006406 [Gallowayella weberi]
MLVEPHDGNVERQDSSPPRCDKIASQPYLDSPLIPLQNSSFPPSSDDNNGSISSAHSENGRHRGRSLAPSTIHYLSTSPAPAQSWRASCIALWTANKGLVFVGLSQLFGALMNVTTRLLETSGEPLNTFQVMFTRMGITLILGTIYMWWAAVEHFPFGPREYLPLAEATVITFLAPMVACWACSILTHEPFPRAEQIAGLVSLVGVILIARPSSFFSLDAGETPFASTLDDAVAATNSTIGLNSQLAEMHGVTSTQRLFAIGVALIGVLGAASAYTTIRMIGQKAHPLISVNYFAAWTALIATAVLLLAPGMEFRLPSGPKQWIYLVFLGVCGFVMQVLLTAGLSYEKSSRATNMVYTNMLFALAFDKLVFDTTLSRLSILGSSLILGSAIYVAVKQDPSQQSKMCERTGGDEEFGLGTNFDNDDTVMNEGRGHLIGVQEVQLRAMRV